MIYETIIIGAGPSGLSVAKELFLNNRDFLILEKGKELEKRNHQNDTDVACGFGGAGLFSDGKLSFAPSATNLWGNLSPSLLKNAYQLFVDWMHFYAIDVPLWDDNWFTIKHKEINGIKNYESIYLTQEQNESILQDLQRTLINNISFDTYVTNIAKNDMFYEIHTSNGIKYKARNIVIASGKYGFNFHNCNINVNYNYLAEVGLRLEMESSMFPFYYEKALDYKKIKIINEFTEIRTFCCCKDGKIINSNIDGVISCNGMLCQEESSNSNIGILIRTTNEKDNIAKEIDALINKFSKIDKILLKTYMESTESFFGGEIDNYLKGFISEVIPNYKDYNKIYCHFPEIERIGKYVSIEKNILRIKDEQIWISGDATGLFRGLSAAFISGIFIANQLNKGLQFKESNFNKMNIVFTAQSKKYFYCKDVVCEYVFKNGSTPINPFNVFGYFLGDRVSRDKVRQGNNTLINSSDELWIFGPISDGVLFEIKLAKMWKKPIKYFSIGTYLYDIKPICIDDIVFEPEVHAKQAKRADLIDFLKGKEMTNEQISIFDIDESEV